MIRPPPPQTPRGTSSPELRQLQVDTVAAVAGLVKPVTEGIDLMRLAARRQAIGYLLIAVAAAAFLVHGVVVIARLDAMATRLDRGITLLASRAERTAAEVAATREEVAATTERSPIVELRQTDAGTDARAPSAVVVLRPRPVASGAPQSAAIEIPVKLPEGARVVDAGVDAGTSEGGSP